MVLGKSSKTFLSWTDQNLSSLFSLCIFTLFDRVFELSLFYLLPLQPRQVRGDAEAAAELPLSHDVFFSVPLRLGRRRRVHLLRLQGDAPLARRDRQQPPRRAQEAAQEEADRTTDRR